MPSPFYLIKVNHLQISKSWQERVPIIFLPLMRKLSSVSGQSKETRRWGCISWFVPTFNLFQETECQPPRWWLEPRRLFDLVSTPVWRGLPGLPQAQAPRRWNLMALGEFKSWFKVRWTYNPSEEARSVCPLNSWPVRVNCSHQFAPDSPPLKTKEPQQLPSYHKLSTMGFLARDL